MLTAKELRELRDAWNALVVYCSWDDLPPKLAAKVKRGAELLGKLGLSSTAARFDAARKHVIAKHGETLKKLAAPKPAKRVCYVCGKNRPPCDRGVYLAHGNGGAYSAALAHRKCVIAAGPIVQSWNEALGWYVRGDAPTLRDVAQLTGGR